MARLADAWSDRCDSYCCPHPRDERSRLSLGFDDSRVITPAAETQTRYCVAKYDLKPKGSRRTMPGTSSAYYRDFIRAVNHVKDLSCHVLILDGDFGMKNNTLTNPVLIPVDAPTNWAHSYVVSV